MTAATLRLRLGVAIHSQISTTNGSPHRLHQVHRRYCSSCPVPLVPEEETIAQQKERRLAEVTTPVPQPVGPKAPEQASAEAAIPTASPAARLGALEAVAMHCRPAAQQMGGAQRGGVEDEGQETWAQVTGSEQDKHCSQVQPGHTSASRWLPRRVGGPGNGRLKRSVAAQWKQRTGASGCIP